MPDNSNANVNLFYVHIYVHINDALVFHISAILYQRLIADTVIGVKLRSINPTVHPWGLTGPIEQ